MSGDPRIAPEVPVPRSGDGSRWGALRVGILGLNAWTVALLIPTLHVGVGTTLETLLAISPLIALGLGVYWLDQRRAWARWALLGAVGPALCLAIALRDELVAREAFDPAGMLLAAVSLLAYLAAAAHALTRPRAPRESSVHPLRTKEPVAEPAPRRWLRRALLGTASMGALAIAVLAPAWAERSARVEAWGDAADDGAVLTAIVAAISAAVALGAVIGPGLRADRKPRDPAKDRRRFALSLGVAIVGAIGWLVLRQLDAG